MNQMHAAEIKRTVQDTHFTCDDENFLLTVSDLEESYSFSAMGATVVTEPEQYMYRKGKQFWLRNQRDFAEQYGKPGELGLEHFCTTHQGWELWGVAEKLGVPQHMQEVWVCACMAIPDDPNTPASNLMERTLHLFCPEASALPCLPEMEGAPPVGAVAV